MQLLLCAIKLRLPGYLMCRPHAKSPETQLTLLQTLCSSGRTGLGYRKAHRDTAHRETFDIFQPR